MKNISFYWYLLALTGALFSCRQNEGNAPYPESSQRVCIGAGIHQGLKTRATRLAMPEGWTLRYVIEVWTMEMERCVYRSEIIQTNGEDISFDFDLEEMGQYTAILWADFIPQGAEQTEKTTPNSYVHFADEYYQTEEGLKEISLIPEAYRVNDESRDAFYATLPINKEEGTFESSATLVRPFGNVNINEKESSLTERVSEIRCTYQVPAVFNTVEGTPGNSILSIEINCTPTKSEYANLFYDYIFAPKIGGMIAYDFTMNFTVADGEKSFKEYIIPANYIPVAQNKRTIANGTILHATESEVPVDTKTNISVTINPVWEENIEDTLPEQNGGNLTNINNQENPFESIL